MPGGIPPGFFLQVAFQGLVQINSCLIGKADQDKQHICQFIAEVERIFIFFERLFAVFPRNNTGYLADFLHQDGCVRQLIKITYAFGFDPVVNDFLCVLYGHQKLSLSAVFMTIVTGPSFSNSIFISAPKMPHGTFFFNSNSSSCISAAYSGIASAGLAALIKEGRFPILVGA